MDISLRVDEEHFEYLKIQKGNLDQYAHDRFDWMVRYQADILATFESIKPHLPLSFDAMLDVGSGLGGIDVLIRRHHDQDRAPAQFLDLHLLDGIDDPPVMNLHRQSFNNMRIARNFQVKNGLHPLKLYCHGTDTNDFGPARFGLVVSFGSWCFHYPPKEYLRQVYRALTPGAVVILDVRNDRPEWLKTLTLAFCGGDSNPPALKLVERPKWTRWLFRSMK